MKIAIPKESQSDETRVAASPEVVGKLIGLGFDVIVESGAGATASFVEAAYKEAGASIAKNTGQALKDADVVLKVQRPSTGGDNSEAAMMKKGAILINTARGGLVNTDDMLEALEKNRLAGAGLDVIEGEDIIKEESQCLHHPESADKCRVFLRDHRIFHMDNVVFTPHNAFNSKEALIRILDTTIENLNTDNKKIVE